MGMTGQLIIIAKYEIKRFSSTMSRDMIPLVIVLTILFVLVSAYTTTSGLHLQDNIYKIGIDSPKYEDIVGNDPRYVVSDISDSRYYALPDLDAAIIDGSIERSRGIKSESAQKSLENDYQSYLDKIYRQQTDLFASYPVWVTTDTVTAELDFLATQSGIGILNSNNIDIEPPVPERIIEYIDSETKLPEITELRNSLELQNGQEKVTKRYTDLLSSEENIMGDYRVPSLISPPLPFDTIIFIFIFIFPLYFTSQFFMMSIMNERTLRQGEALIAAPVNPFTVIFGKMLPYFFGMFVIVIILMFWIKAPLTALPPLIPVILFFLAFALFIGMIAGSYRELSFISIFFSTIATSYLFFPSIFANVHIVSLLSPVTLVIYSIDGTGYSATDYMYSTSLFFMVSLILFIICIRNYNEEQLFTNQALVSKLAVWISSLIPNSHPYISLLTITAVTIPFVFMTQMMVLVLFFNLPMPISIILIMFCAALVEEIAKSIGFVGLYKKNGNLSYFDLIIGSILIGAGFILGEKLLLFVTLSQISDSIFGEALFLSMGYMILPFLLHTICVFVSGFTLKKGGSSYLPFGIIFAMIIHLIYNLYLLGGFL